MDFFGFLGIPLGWILRLAYKLVSNYGFALILFTLITKLILLPLNFKQQKSMVQTNLLQPKLEALQKQYGNDKEKYSEEMMKLYKKNGVNPMAGCLPLLIQFPILFALFDVIKKPLTYIWGLSADTIAQLTAQFPSDVVQTASSAVYSQIDLAKSLFSAGNQYGIDFSFFGLLDLSQTPRFDFAAPMFGIDWIWLIPILAAFTTWLSSKFMNIGMDKPKKEDKKATRPPKPGEKDPSSTANMMTNIMPFMTLWFTFIMPAGISVYWIAGNLIQIGQQYVLNRHYVPKIKERMSKENEELENTRKKRKNNRRSR